MRSPAEAEAGAKALSEAPTEAAVAAPLYEQSEAAVSSDKREREKVGS